ncbi:MAG TPA: hypothetical protein VFY87_32060 [Geminicoccaceae bacterium]|jgi:hypothetical protein|nr:hypothetical protein [Geminicoccaceae bacterium]
MPNTHPDRRRALAELDARIDQTERTRARCRLDLADRAGGLRGTGRTAAALRLVEERLALLRQSRQVLLAGVGTHRN